MAGVIPATTGKHMIARTPTPGMCGSAVSDDCNTHSAVAFRCDTSAVKTEWITMRIEPERKRRWVEAAGGQRRLARWLTDAAEARLQTPVEASVLVKAVSGPSERLRTPAPGHHPVCRCTRCRIGVDSRKRGS